MPVMSSWRPPYITLNSYNPAIRPVAVWALKNLRSVAATRFLAAMRVRLSDAKFLDPFGPDIPKIFEVAHGIATSDKIPFVHWLPREEDMQVAQRAPQYQPPDFSSNLASRYAHFDITTLWGNRRYGDFCLVCNENTYYAHRFVLMAQSPVLDRMLNGSYNEAILGRTEVPDEYDGQTLDAFLEYLYTGKIHFLEEAENLLKSIRSQGRTKASEYADRIDKKPSDSNLFCDELCKAIIKGIKIAKLADYYQVQSLSCFAVEWLIALMRDTPNLKNVSMDSFVELIEQFLDFPSFHQYYKRLELHIIRLSEQPREIMLEDENLKNRILTHKSLVGGWLLGTIKDTYVNWWKICKGLCAVLLYRVRLVKLANNSLTQELRIVRQEKEGMQKQIEDLNSENTKLRLAGIPDGFLREAYRDAKRPITDLDFWFRSHRHCKIMHTSEAFRECLAKGGAVRCECGKWAGQDYGPANSEGDTSMSDVRST